MNKPSKRYTIRPLKLSGQYEVRNDMKEITYLVDVNTPSCNCKDKKFKSNGDCKHITMAKGIENRKF